MNTTVKLNAIEKSIIDSFNGVTNKKVTWKLFSSRYVNKDMELKTEREKKVYAFLCEFLESEKNKSWSMLNTKKFKTLFVDWGNSKLIESVNLIVTEKEIDKALKNYFKENFLTLSKYFGLAMNSDKNDKNVYIVQLCKESGIYQFREKTENQDTKKKNTTLETVSKSINDLSTLCNSLNSDDKKQAAALLLALASSLGVVGSVTKKSKSKKSA